MPNTIWTDRVEEWLLVLVSIRLPDGPREPDEPRGVLLYTSSNARFHRYRSTPSRFV